MNLRLRFIASFILQVGLFACGSAPPISEMRTHAQCHVWVEGSLGNAAARVDERAYVHGSFGEVEAAYFVSQDKLEWPGAIGTVHGTYRNRELVIHGSLSDIGPIFIGDGRATVEGTLGDLEFEFNRRCTDRQAAMGVMSITVAVASK